MTLVDRDPDAAIAAKSSRSPATLLREIRWRRALPPRWGWARLVASPSSYLLFVAFVITGWAKASILAGIDGAGAKSLLFVWSLSADALVLFTLAALFALGEARVRWIAVVTTVLAAGVLAVSLVNAAYLSVSGEQVTWSTVRVGLARWDDFWGIAADSARHEGWFRLLGLGLVVLALPIGARILVKRATGAWQPLADGKERSHCAIVIALPGLIVWGLAPEPSSIPVRNLGGNAVVSTYWSWVTDDASASPTVAGSFAGYDPPQIVDDAELARFGQVQHRPNIVLLVWESTRYDFTQLAGPDAPARTPNLVALAGRGVVAHRARAVMPHTTKSLFSMLCARFPLMQFTTGEVSATIHTQCLPAILSSSGYRTAFLQSALGSFEERPRLVDRLGFEHFEAWEEIKGEPLGYLASNDAALAPALARWLEEEPAGGGPFFATLLTSSTHHPYDLPESTRARLMASGATANGARERYARLVESEDALLGAVVETLRAHGVLDDTIIVVVGDHGEGFGEKGVRQHDANFYEEGLHVPFVIAGPEVMRGEIQGNVSLVDLTPTVLGLLDLRVSERAAPTIDGRDVMRAPTPENQPRYFGCWLEARCRGFVVGTRKVVEVPQTHSIFWFDLAADPNEQRPLPLTPELRALLPGLEQVIDAHQTRSWPLELGETRTYGRWRCPAGRPCQHPDSPRGGFFRGP